MDLMHADEEIVTDWSDAGRILRRLIRQLFFSVFFGICGLNALWWSKKLYGSFMLITFSISLVLFHLLGIWHLFILTGFFWFLDVATMISRIVIHTRGIRLHRRSEDSAASEEQCVSA